MRYNNISTFGAQVVAGHPDCLCWQKAIRLLLCSKRKTQCVTALECVVGSPLATERRETIIYGVERKQHDERSYDQFLESLIIQRTQEHNCEFLKKIQGIVLQF